MPEFLHVPLALVYITFCEMANLKLLKNFTVQWTTAYKQAVSVTVEVQYFILPVLLDV